jgi:3'(2'), 5'-bisphosphate nucleotidase
MMSVDLLKLCVEKSEEAAGAASRVLLNVISSTDEELHIESKIDGSLVSDADLASQMVISDILSPLGIPIISEEASIPDYDKRKDWPLYWLIDPLDGTESFLSNRSGFAVNIALCDKSGPILGVVADPLTNTIYKGVMGDGFSICTLDGSNSRQITPRETRRPYRLVTSWNEDAPLEELTPPWINIEEVVARPVSGSLKFCEIALGSAEIHSRTGSYMEWDCAAGDAILRSIDIEVFDRHTHKRIVYNSEDLRVNGLYASRV